MATSDGSLGSSGRPAGGGSAGDRPAGGRPAGDLATLYQDLILRHHRRPKHRGALDAPTVEVRVANPTCGDTVSLALRVAAGVITEARFDGEGCAISQASASMMTTGLQGRSLAEAEALATRFGALMAAEPGAAHDPLLGDLRALASVAGFPIRVRCALLAFDALRLALAKVRDGDALLSPVPRVP